MIYGGKNRLLWLCWTYFNIFLWWFQNQCEPFLWSLKSFRATLVKKLVKPWFTVFKKWTQNVNIIVSLNGSIEFYCCFVSLRHVDIDFVRWCVWGLDRTGHENAIRRLQWFMMWFCRFIAVLRRLYIQHRDEHCSISMLKTHIHIISIHG